MKLDRHLWVPNWVKFFALVLLVSIAVALVSYAFVILTGLSF